MQFTAQVVCPIARRWELFRGDERLARVSVEMLSEVLELSEVFSFKSYDDSEHKVSVSVFENVEKPFWFYEKWRPPTDLPMPYSFILFESEIVCSEADWKSCVTESDGSPLKPGHFSDDELMLLYKQGITSSLSEFVFMYALAANIAKPGSLQLEKRLLFFDRTYYETKGGAHNMFDVAFDEASKLGWPPMSSISANSVMSWLSDLPGFEKGEAITPLGRAVGALTYLQNPTYKDENDLALVWALIGLEALYGIGSTALRSQLLEKSQAYLGKMRTNKKGLGRMYDYRSRLIHGDADFTFNRFYGRSHVSERFENSRGDSELMAIATLIATMQKMCAEKRYELGFHYEIN